MKFYSLTLATFVLLIGCASATPILSGTWKITQEAGASPISGLSDEQVKSTIGTKMTLNPQEFTLGNMKCLNPQTQTSSIPLKQFFDDYRIERPSKLDDKARAVEINCDKGSFANPILISGNTLMFVLDGVLFEARKLEY